MDDLIKLCIEQELRDCKTCIHSDKGHCAGTEECHECMWENKYGKDPSEYKSKTNLDRIKEMDAEQLVRFLRLCDFTRIYPVIEGETFYNEEDVIAWLYEEAK